MNYNNDHVSDINIAYIGGGSRNWAWILMTDLAMEEKLSGNVKLYDIDFQAAYDNEIIGNKLNARKDVKGKWNYKAVKSLEEALNGADFVIISIIPGTFKEMASDVHAPEKYGIYQPVGDTTGPGGLMRALRTIPIFIDFAKSIKKYAPDAWVINYTNPMSLCTKSLYHGYPEIKTFGCCHEVFHTQTLLTYMLNDMQNIKGIPREEIKINILGINHFTWLDYAVYKDIDLFPLYNEFSEKYYKNGYDGIKTWPAWVFSCTHRIKFDLFKRYGLIACAGDRHLVEFMPPIYLKDLGTVRSWGFYLTAVDWRIDDRKAKMNRSKRLLKGEEEIQLIPSGEEGVRQIKALAGLDDLVTNVNLPNQGQIKNLPEGCIVETNALFRKNSIKPVLAGKLPPDIKSLIDPLVANHERILNAAINYSKELAFEAFINDPLVTIKQDDAKKLFEEMLFNIKEYLPGWDI